MRELLGFRFVAPTCATGALGTHRLQASGMEEALAAAALRHIVHLKREQERIRPADFAKMPES